MAHWGGGCRAQKITRTARGQAVTKDTKKGCGGGMLMYEIIIHRKVQMSLKENDIIYYMSYAN